MVRGTNPDLATDRKRAAELAGLIRDVETWLLGAAENLGRMRTELARVKAARDVAGAAHAQLVKADVVDLAVWARSRDLLASSTSVLSNFQAKMSGALSMVASKERELAAHKAELEEVSKRLASRWGRVVHFLT